MKIEGKQVLVTGADGFIGSHLVELLVERGAKVRALAQYNSFNDWGWLEGLSCLEDIEVVTGDIRDPHFCETLVENIEVVFHLAALIAIPYSYVAPGSYVSTNVSGTLNICQAALAKGCERVVHTSTSEVYGTARYVPIDEAHPLQPQSPYSASKIAADAIARSYYLSFNLPLITARPFNTFGPRQSARAIIPTIISQIAAGQREISLGDLRPTRDLNYVEDTCSGMLSLAETDDAIGEEVNLGSGREISMGDLCSLIARLMNEDIEIRCDTERLRPDKSEVFRLCADRRKVENLTGFDPGFSLEEGLKRTIEWFSESGNLQRYKLSYNL